VHKIKAYITTSLQFLFTRHSLAPEAAADALAECMADVYPPEAGNGAMESIRLDWMRRFARRLGEVLSEWTR
jgi:hypothetical protein